MLRHMSIPKENRVVTLASEIVYGQRSEWCGATYRPLKLSLMRSRQFFEYDRKEKLPLIVWLCGGGFTTMDRNVWIPELAWFAKRGYAVASVEYGTTCRTRFPEQLEDIKAAIRFLRAHAKEYNLDPERFALAGESAGGYLSLLAGVTGEDQEYKTGGYEEFPENVQAVVAFYPVTKPSEMDFCPELVPVPPDFKQYPDIMNLLKDECPPTMLLHGDTDTQVQPRQSEELYRALTDRGIPAECCILEGAEHADEPFIQEETKHMVLEFLNKHLKKEGRQ